MPDNSPTRVATATALAAIAVFAHNLIRWAARLGKARSHDVLTVALHRARPTGCDPVDPSTEPGKRYYDCRLHGHRATPPRPRWIMAAGPAPT